MAGMGAVVNHCGSWLWVAWRANDGAHRHALALGDGAARQHQRGGAVGVGRGAGRRDGAVAAEGRLQQRDLVGRDLQRVLVVGNELVAAFDGHGDGRDLGLEAALAHRGARARQRLDGEGVLVGARELVALGRRLAEVAHAAAASRRRPRGRRAACGRGCGRGRRGSRRAPWPAGTARWSSTPCRRRRRCRRCPRR